MTAHWSWSMRGTAQHDTCPHTCARHTPARAYTHHHNTTLQLSTSLWWAVLVHSGRMCSLSVGRGDRAQGGTEVSTCEHSQPAVWSTAHHRSEESARGPGEGLWSWCSSRCSVGGWWRVAESVDTWGSSSRWTSPFPCAGGHPPAVASAGRWSPWPTSGCS